ncbi:ABC transporter permease [Nocardioides lianchengensis]|jgi:ABC-2 type transport system permease protein|uniref:ABC-2 type transport system permease protein n=1 Tax=Nocardioides lianchengensis TaxID=1045774 RepID=A0A1G6LBY6_9ACTN|nr:ABC transporter permease [Nocardioides lianchengensis]NYG12622.1 ABC-2 type transport system permease protein [Nocardioides lianchengensis]SDC40255.1 ABC-2 type transport system permease protein [Nocardioides lianchengensis]
MTTMTFSSTSPALRRTTGLTKANGRLMLRNRLNLAYGFVLPLLPLAFLLVGDRGDVGSAGMALVSVIVMAALFPVYYNVLSMTVTRRDELVLKRIRTGETRDLELLTSLALPGVAVAMIVGLGAIPLALALGAPVPVNPVMFVLTVLVSALVFAVLAFWTAAWTKNAEAAQITSMPVILLAVVGQVAISFPEEVRRWIDLTPGAAITDLVRSSWLGLDGPSTDPSLSFGETWAAAGQPLLVLAAWAALAAWLAARSMRWEPRS